MDWLYKGLEMYTYITFVSITFKFIALILMFVCVHHKIASVYASPDKNKTPSLANNIKYKHRGKDISTTKFNALPAILLNSEYMLFST